ncbi:RloB family protein [Spirosoma sp. 209]|uniref:RloB family protein n=1 Tax=Spirosoma sp. 209 TaxID=1955701 RepID=UPI00098D1C72|nr:RloB family protein [Spirosoma sp. 209]PHK17632.1 hypothetical protein VF12_39640 [Nostoc linckia z15]PHK28786.1 hypothetical protein VF13_40540 [Nostoc linckia z16]
MARVAKIDNASKKRFERQETKRLQNARPKRRFYLIVCEGTKTEPLYFEGLKKNLPPHVLELIDLSIEGTGRNTLGVINEALKAKARIESQPGRVIDETWTVFDRDSFPNQNFDNAIAKAQELGVYCAWSNEAFELWYLLHFQHFQQAIRREHYQKLLEKELSRCMGKSYQYDKNSQDVYNLLKQFGNEEQAIKRARQLEQQFAGRTDYANHNPCTRVYALVERLRSQIPPKLSS